ncbi:hypothetical protein [Pararhizobium haloflavum]|uniref:hypothetical protein n=1 Tax=Pararhizobium haloflavum TaxID=2037914 RepID=UPI000C190324|nr:hypothetical protein [Pararhizobium haloflavum]
MKLDQFENKLADMIGRPTDLRPFVCEGSPLDCKIFLVGFNPATELANDFWHFWRPGYGFDKQEWLRSYAATRSVPKPGKTRRLAISPTRLRIESFVEGASPVRILETNIFSADSADMQTLHPSRREIAPFHFLLETIMPEVVVAHGKTATAAVEVLKGPWKFVSAGHFSRYETKRSAGKLGREAAAFVQGGG